MLKFCIRFFWDGHSNGYSSTDINTLVPKFGHDKFRFSQPKNSNPFQFVFSDQISHSFNEVKN